MGENFCVLSGKWLFAVKRFAVAFLQTYTSDQQGHDSQKRFTMN